MLKHVIFDFDGVLADSFDVNWALSQQHDTDATLEDFLAHHDGNVFAEPRITFKPESVPLFYAEYRKRINATHLERARASVERLGAQYQLHIVSSMSDEVIAEVLGHGGLLPLFTRILGADTHPSKVEKFHMLMRENGVTAENAIFITDTLGDIKEAHKVGIKTIAETFGYHSRERLLAGGPYRIVDSWEEIQAEIASFG